MNQFSKTDIPVLVLSAAAVLVAAVLSMATMTSNKNNERLSQNIADPYTIAQIAAKEGVDAARWHIECHGWVRQGSLSSHYCINGAIYRVEWDDVNLSDSTVAVRSCGKFPFNGDEDCTVIIESKIKLTFLPECKNEILPAYYSKIREPINTAVVQ
jgi:hypothetical protein